MVESSGDNIKRPITYAQWRVNKPATPGHTQELVSVNLAPELYD
jgi:hypothetical protein